MAPYNKAVKTVRYALWDKQKAALRFSFCLPLTFNVIQNGIRMHSDINISKCHKNIKIEGMVTKPVRGVTDEGTTIYEDNLQLELKNVGKKSISFIDCTISYRDKNNKFIGSDSDGTFDELKPNENCIISIPFFIPDNTIKKELDITAQFKESNIYAIKYWLIAIMVAFIIIGNILK